MMMQRITKVQINLVTETMLMEIAVENEKKIYLMRIILKKLYRLYLSGN